MQRDRDFYLSRVLCLTSPLCVKILTKARNPDGFPGEGLTFPAVRRWSVTKKVYNLCEGGQIKCGNAQIVTASYSSP